MNVEQEKLQEKFMEDKQPTIIVCVDNSNASLVALKYASLKAKKLGFKTEILSILEPSHKNLIFGSHKIAVEKRDKIEKFIQNAIDEIFEDKDYVPAVEIREGDVGDEIIKEVRGNPNCVSLVLGKSQRSSQSDNTVLSKMAQRFSRKIKVPIMIVPENIDENIFKLMV